MSRDQKRFGRSELKYLNKKIQQEGARRTFHVCVILCLVFPFLLMNSNVAQAGMLVGSRGIFLLAGEAMGILCATVGYVKEDGARFFWLDRRVCLCILAGILDLSVILVQSKIYCLLMYALVALGMAWATLWKEKYALVSMCAQIGVLLFASYVRGWEADLMIAMAITQGFSIIISLLAYHSYIRKIHNDYYLRQALKDAQTDPMTNLYNRRGLEEKIGGIWQLCQRHHIPVGMIMMDIDDFKKFNDEFGHPAGDGCIKMVARQIQKNARRRNDIVARVGGEEFLVVFTGMTLEQVIERAQVMQHMVYNYKMRHAKEAKYTYVSISAGVAFTDFKENYTQFKDLYDLADQHLYQAKQKGKNCIYVGEHSTATA